MLRIAHLRSHCSLRRTLCSIASLTRGVPVLGESGLVANARNFVPPSGHKKRPQNAVFFGAQGGVD
jgi:hypothetical protein